MLLECTLYYGIQIHQIACDYLSQSGFVEFIIP